MKYQELKKGTLGLIHWLKSTAKNPTILIGSSDLRDVAEVCWAFTLPLEDIEKMTPQKVKSEVNSFMRDLTADDFQALQNHAEKEIKKFFSTDTRPKKQSAPHRVQKKRAK